MRKHSQHNNDEWTHFFRKIYLSHFTRNGCERVTKGLCVRGELGTEQTATYWPPVPLSLAALLSRSAGLLNRGPWGPSSLLGLVLTASNCNKLTPTNWTCLWRRVISLFDIQLLPVSVASAPNSTRPRSRLYLDVFDRMHLFFNWRLGWRSICYRKWTRRHEFKSWTRLITFHIALIPFGKVWIQLYSLQLCVNSRADWVLQPWRGN